MGAIAGAAVAVLVLTTAAVAVLWSISDPVPPARPAAEPPQSPSTDRVVDPEPPSDLGEDESWLSDMDLEAATLVTPESLLWNVTAVGEQVRSGPGGLLVGTMAIDATVPFEVVADEIGDGATVGMEDDSRAWVTRTVTVLGRELRVEATGTVQVESGQVVVEPRTIDIGGPDLLGEALGGAVRQLVTIRHSVEGIPDGLVLQEVGVQDDGFRVRLEGEDVRLGG